MRNENDCGCCGREMHSNQMYSSQEWCADCSVHVEHGTLPPWRRTYEAQHGVPCPYQTEPVQTPQGAGVGAAQ